MTTTATPNRSPGRWLNYAAEVKQGRLSAMEIDILLRGGPDMPRPITPDVLQALNTLRRGLRQERRIFNEWAHWSLFWYEASEYLRRTSGDGDPALAQQAARALDISKYSFERFERANNLLNVLDPKKDCGVTE